MLCRFACEHATWGLHVAVTIACATGYGAPDMWFSSCPEPVCLWADDLGPWGMALIDGMLSSILLFLDRCSVMVMGCISS